jgi:hypothetical protein
MKQLVGALGHGHGSYAVVVSVEPLALLSDPLKKPKRLTKNATALVSVEPPDQLRKHLNRYTECNTSDYFVHKDSKGFLE